MKKQLLTLALSISLFTGFSQTEKKDYTEAFKLIEVWLEAQKDFEQLPGLTAIVVEDQEVLWAGGFGLANMEAGVKAQPSTLFSICSISKLFTAVAIMKLYDEGKLRLDDEVSQILPWYDLKQKFPDSGPITVRGLLTHSSGLPREANAPYWTGPDFPFPTSEEVKAGLGKQETLYPASTYLQYSNLGLTLLGEIVEQVSGMPYEDYVRKNILDPLGLSDTRTELPEPYYGKELAIGYTPPDRKGDREKVNFFDAKGIAAAAGFSSNVQDLGKFAAWQFRLMDTTVTEILKPSTLKNMHTVHWTNPDFKTTWGLGFVVYKGSDDSKWVSHGGSCPGYRSTLQIHPKSKRAFSVMINAGGADPDKYVKGINGILGKVKSAKKEEAGKDAKPEKDLSDYVGFYSPVPWWSEVWVGSWEGKLVTVGLPSENPTNSMTFYKHIEGDTFRRIRDDDELGETLTFERDEKGRITRYQSHGTFTRKMER